MQPLCLDTPRAESRAPAFGAAMLMVSIAYIVDSRDHDPLQQKTARAMYDAPELCHICAPIDVRVQVVVLRQNVATQPVMQYTLGRRRRETLIVDKLARC